MEALYGKLKMNRRHAMAFKCCSVHETPENMFNETTWCFETVIYPLISKETPGKPQVKFTLKAVDP